MIKPMLDQRGVSLLEVLIATVIIGILAVLMSNFFVDRLIDYARTFNQTILQTNTKQAVETMEKDIKSAQTVETNNRWPDNNAPGAPTDPYSWASITNTPSVLVLAVPAVDSSGNLIYLDAAHNTIQTNDVIYYVDPATDILYRRTIANPVSDNIAVTTCPPAVANAGCPPDAKVVEDVASLTTSYLDSSNNATLNPDHAGSVIITLQQSRVQFSITYKSILTSQATLRNK